MLGFELHLRWEMPASLLAVRWLDMQVVVLCFCPVLPCPALPHCSPNLPRLKSTCCAGLVPGARRDLERPHLVPVGPHLCHDCAAACGAWVEGWLWAADVGRAPRVHAMPGVNLRVTVGMLRASWVAAAGCLFCLKA